MITWLTINTEVNGTLGDKPCCIIKISDDELAVPMLDEYPTQRELSMLEEWGDSDIGIILVDKLNNKFGSFRL